MEFQDRTIKCATCGREFLFTAKEQDFFVTKGFKEPRHCRECRQQRKQEREQAVAQASGQPYHPGKEMFKVVCANCHRETTVPFKPITGKPVLCKDCFIAQRFGTLLPGIEKGASTDKLPIETTPPVAVQSEVEPQESVEGDPGNASSPGAGTEIKEDSSQSGRQQLPDEGTIAPQSETAFERENYRIAAKKHE